jgi:hypothetical protein
MRSKIGTVALVMAVAGCGTAADTGDDVASGSEALGANTQRPGERFVRIRPIDMNQGGGWVAHGYTAPQIVDLVKELRPEVLDRYISGDVSPHMALPSGAEPAMDATQFLNATEQSESCNRVITPRVSLGEYPKTFFTTTAHLLEFPVHPVSMHYVSLDNWAGFVDSHGAKEIEGVFKRLYNQGWKRININDCGLPSNAPPDHVNGYGLATGADIGVDATTWEPNREHLRILRASKNIQLILLYIDFPGPMDKFKKLSPDRQAEILTSLAEKQKEEGYTLVYNILQDVPEGIDWDATKVRTSRGGRFHGKTIFEVMKGLMDKYNPAHKCT